MCKLVQMTHVCQYWRSTLVSCPHLWSSIFVKTDHKDFVAACLARSQGLPLTVRLDLKYGDYLNFPKCTRTRYERSSGIRINKDNPSRYHTAIDPLLGGDHAQRIRKLDVHLDILDDYTEKRLNEYFKDALDDFKFFALPLPILESFSFCVDHGFQSYTHLGFPGQLFHWGNFPPTELRHLALHGCYGGTIRAVRNLTSFELAAEDGSDSIPLNQHTFLPFISGSPSLVSLHLLRCSFPGRAQLSRVTPAKLPELKSLQLMEIEGLSGFPGLIEVPAFKALSSLLSRLETLSLSPTPPAS